MALTAEQLAYALSADTATAERLLPVAVALVDRYAPSAPEAVRDEAAIRCAGWLGRPAERRRALGDDRRPRCDNRGGCPWVEGIEGSPLR